MPKLNMILDKRFYFLLIGMLLFGSLEAKSKEPLSIVEMHRLAEDVINYEPDSTLVLLDMAAEKIATIKDKDLAEKYWAENNLRRADYWIFRDNEKAKVYLENAFYYFSNEFDNKKLAEVYLIKAQLIREVGLDKNAAIQDALPYFDSAVSHALRYDDAKLLSFVYYEKAFALQQIERWQESFENAFLSIQFAEQSEDSLSMATAYFLMGRTYIYFGFSDHSEEYIAKAIAYGKGMHRIFSIIHIYADILMENNKVEKALENYQLALSICLENGRMVKAIELYTNIGKIQLETGDFQAAEKTYEALNELVVQQNYTSIKTTLFFAQMQNYLGRYELALGELQKIKNRYSESRLNAFELDVYKNVADLYKTLGVPVEAAFFYEKWGTLKDSLQTYTSRLQLGELEKMYLNERTKNQEITAKNDELESSRTNQAVLGGVVLVVVLLGASLVYYTRLRGLKENQALKFSLKEKQLEQLMEVQESERQRLARELHDGIGQSLAALKMQLQLAEDVQSSKVTVKRVDALCKEVRMLSHQMMPLVLKENGLKAAIEQLIEQMFANTAIEVDLVTHSFAYRLPESVETHLYRITQELITNIIKHANATKVGVQLLNRNNKILLIVEDNGKGFNKEESSIGLGLNNVNSRVEALEGSLKIQSSATEGTFVRISIPMLVHLNKQTA